MKAMARILLCRGRPHFKVPRWEGCWIGQTLQFMIDMLPTIRELIREWPREKVLEVFDVGTGSGAGANLLGALYRSPVFGLQMKVEPVASGLRRTGSTAGTATRSGHSGSRRFAPIRRGFVSVCATGLPFAELDSPDGSQARGYRAGVEQACAA